MIRATEASMTVSVPPWFHPNEVLVVARAARFGISKEEAHEEPVALLREKGL
jgi:hypothetical protein